jgi:hypothetical protein
MFRDVNMWLNDVRSLYDPSAAVIRVGNKADLATNRAATLAETEAWSENPDSSSEIDKSALIGRQKPKTFPRPGLGGIGEQCICLGCP